MWYLFFCTWITFLIVPLHFHPCCQKWQDFIICYDWIVFHCIYVPHVLYPSVHEHLGIFHFLAIVSNAVINITMQMYLWQADLISFDFIPSGRIAGSHGSFIYNFLRSFHTVFHKDCTSLHFHHQCVRVLFSPSLR